ncbi:MAG: hypothetical protein ACE5KE_00550 [Methanosarcinales archaeon]
MKGKVLIKLDFVDHDWHDNDWWFAKTISAVQNTLKERGVDAEIVIKTKGTPAIPSQTYTCGVKELKKALRK